MKKPSPFVQRLIPTVAAATFTLTACGPGDEEGNGANNDGTNNQMTNGSTNGATNGTPNGATNGTPNGATNGATNAGTNNGSTNAGTNNGSTNAGTNNGSTNGETEYVQVDGDGTVSDMEIRAFCQAWSDCDSAYFQESYDTVDDCFGVQRDDLDETLELYENEYGADCAAVEEKIYECYLAAFGCTSGEFGYEVADLDACYVTYQAEFDAACK